MKKLKSIVEDNTTMGGRIFEVTVQVLIIVSLITFTFETLPDNPPEITYWMERSELFCVIFFTLEYLLRIIVADKPFRFMFSFYGIIDLMAILPFYLALGVDFRSARAFRLLRLFRAFKIIRYSKALHRFSKAIKYAKEELILFTFVTMILLYLASVGIYYFEGEAQPEKFGSIFDSMWWSVTTLTTVGYGDAYPITVGGKIFTFVILMIGLGMISIPAGIIASAFGQVRREESDTVLPVVEKEDAPTKAKP